MEVADWTDRFQGYSSVLHACARSCRMLNSLNSQYLHDANIQTSRWRKPGGALADTNGKGGSEDICFTCSSGHVTYDLTFGDFFCFVPSPSAQGAEPNAICYNSVINVWLIATLSTLSCCLLVWSIEAWCKEGNMRKAVPWRKMEKIGCMI